MSALGCDLEQVARFARLLGRARFMAEVYTAGERSHIAASARPERTAAGLWCAKEACAKALGAGLYGLLPRELEVCWDERGAPEMRLLGAAAARYPGKRPRVSVSHAKAYAMAVVLLED